MTTLRVPEMMCENCVRRITKALSAEDMRFTVSLETKTVALEQGDPKKAIDALAAVGFDAEQA